MKKTLAILLPLFALASTSFAQPHLGGSIFWFNGDEYDSALGTSLRGGYLVDPMSFELEVNYLGEDGAFDDLTGDIDTIAAFAQFRAMPQVADLIRLYGGFGIGFARVDVNMVRNTDGTRVEDQEYGFAWQVFAGILYNALDQVDVQVGLRGLGVGEVTIDGETRERDAALLVDIGVMFTF